MDRTPIASSSLSISPGSTDRQHAGRGVRLWTGCRASWVADEFGGGLSEVALGQSADTHFGTSKSRDIKHFRVLDPGQKSLAPLLNDTLPTQHTVRLIAELVDEHVDSVPIRAACDAGHAVPHHDPRLLLRILLHAYTTGVHSSLSQVIERSGVDDVPFRWLAEGAAADYRAIVPFGKQHASAIGTLFVEALALCRAAGMGRVARVALDRMTVPDTASTRE
jgi:transposase